jgi:hypothetical protein
LRRIPAMVIPFDDMERATAKPEDICISCIQAIHSCVGGFFCRTIFEPIKLFAYDDLPREKNTKAFERSNVDLFARLRDMGFGPILQICQALEASGDSALRGVVWETPCVSTILWAAWNIHCTCRCNLKFKPFIYMRLVFFDSAGKGRNLSKSNIRICQGVFFVCVRVR